MHPAELFWTATIGFVVVGSLGWLLSIYNGFIELRNQIGRAWANIDVLLKQRHDEVPKLVSICEGHMAHERAVFDRLSDARAASRRDPGAGRAWAWRKWMGSSWRHPCRHGRAGH